MKQKYNIEMGYSVPAEFRPPFTIPNKANVSKKFLRILPKSIVPQVLIMTSFPPRECGIANYSDDLIKTIESKFLHTFSIRVCAIENKEESYIYNSQVSLVLDTSSSQSYRNIEKQINQDRKIGLVVVQHEFGFFNLSGGADFQSLLDGLIKPVVVVFHTVLPKPDAEQKSLVVNIANACVKLIVMTHSSREILENDYGIIRDKIEVIAHGTHLVLNENKNWLKGKYNLKNQKILSTFGLLGPGKSVETTLDALPAIVEQYPEVVFLIIGKTHPGIVATQGESYREMLQNKVNSLNLNSHVRFINQYLELPVLLEYLRMTDIYLFTSSNPYQAVSGTFSYAMSCACPIISTPIPQAKEMLDDETGIIIDFFHSEQLAKGVIKLLGSDKLREQISMNTLQKIAPTAWENSALKHCRLFLKIMDGPEKPEYQNPDINLNHIRQLTTEFGIIQFARINRPDIESGYTLDDNARAMVSICMHFELTGDKNDLKLIRIYLNFIMFCIMPDGKFLNYVDKNRQFSKQNTEVNLEDSNGRAIWALGFVVSKKDILPFDYVLQAEGLLKRAMPLITQIHSSRAMAFCIKGLYYYHLQNHSSEAITIIESLADRLCLMYEHESDQQWHWFESYLTYANSVLPEAMLMAAQCTNNPIYQYIAEASFAFLLSQTFNSKQINVISNRSWFSKGEVREKYGEQPIDVAYTIMTLNEFYKTSNNAQYKRLMKKAFEWFLGNNHLDAIIYNPCTGGCYDGLEETQVNLNQGAESSISYLMARITIENHIEIPHFIKPKVWQFGYSTI